MTSNVQLENYVKRNPQRFLGQKFLGVFSADDLPSINQYNCSLIVNYSPSNKPGTHWCAMKGLCPSNGSATGKRVEFFGSYGLTPDQVYPIVHFQREGFERYMHKFGGDINGITYNDVDLQSWKEGENECGEWALVFLMEGEPNPQNPVWAKFLTINDKVKRDQMVRKYIGIVNE